MNISNINLPLQHNIKYNNIKNKKNTNNANNINSNNSKISNVINATSKNIIKADENINNSDLNSLDSGLYEGNDFEAKLKRAMENKDEKALKEACQQVEEIFLQMMYKQMKATIPKSELFSESISEDILNSMLDETLMKEAAKANGIGLADVMYKQLHKKMDREED